MMITHTYCLMLTGHNVFDKEVRYKAPVDRKHEYSQELSK